MPKEKTKLSLLDRYILYRDEKWVGRDLIPREAAEELLEDPTFFSEHWRARALLNQAIRAILKFERKIARKGAATERVDVLRRSMPEVHTQDAGAGVATMAAPKVKHVQAEVHTVTGEEWIRRLEKAKQETEGQRQELKRLWSVMQKELKSHPSERRKVEKHFSNDHSFQMLLNIEGIEEE